MSDDKIHAMHSPSSSNIWLDCSLHYHYKKEALGKGAVWDTGGEAAKRGTIQHTVAEKAMNSIQNGLDVETAVDRAIRTLRFKLTEEERENVTLSMHMVLDLTTDTMDVQTEVSVDLSYEPGSTGTVDLLGDWDGQHYMLVADYKYGQTPVSPNSSQLKIYGASAINRDELDPDFEVKLAVIQPKLHSEALVRSYTVQELVEWQAQDPLVLLKARIEDTGTALPDRIVQIEQEELTKIDAAFEASKARFEAFNAQVGLVAPAPPNPAMV